MAAGLLLFGVGSVRAADPELPTPLGDTDIKRYQQIFDVQERGDWKTADRLVKQLADPLLLGHVLAQRYLHPNRYRSKYKELKAWMASYADHPDARRLYKLALRRKPANWRSPKPPIVAKGATQAAMVSGRAEAPPSRNLNAKNRSRARSLQARVTKALRRGQTLVAKKLIDSTDAKRLLSAAEHDILKGKLAKGYFHHGRIEWAGQWAEAAVNRSGALVPEAHWTLGLVQWRQGNFAGATEHFRAAAEGPRTGENLAGAAAFWAARGALKSGQPARVAPLLEIAAKDQRGFYGLLARSILGQRLGFRWTPPPLPASAFTALDRQAAGRRALALLQIGEVRRAERELAPLATVALSNSDRDLALGLLGVAARGGMASLAVKLDARLFPNGGGYDGAAYPIPEWMPGEDFSVDRALVYALIRQESRFNPKAKSWAGARGLMQIMPGTARFVARSEGVRWKGRRHLFTPETNLDLGQRYIVMLLDEKVVGGDMFLLAAAWNGGPGNLSKWRKVHDYDPDPLYFIEAIPNRETRHFVKEVLANLWIYRDRLAQAAPSLQAVARGAAPVYTALGHGNAEIAENGTRQ